MFRAIRNNWRLWRWGVILPGVTCDEGCSQRVGLRAFALPLIVLPVELLAMLPVWKRRCE